MTMHKQYERNWRSALFCLLGATIGVTVMGMQPVTPSPKLVPVSGLAWVPDDPADLTRGHLVGVASNGTLVQSLRETQFIGRPFAAWKPAPLR